MSGISIDRLWRFYFDQRRLSASARDARERCKEGRSRRLAAERALAEFEVALPAIPAAPRHGKHGPTQEERLAATHARLKREVADATHAYEVLSAEADALSEARNVAGTLLNAGIAFCRANGVAIPSDLEQDD